MAAPRVVKLAEGLPHGVREIRNAWIELASGARLAARIWLPEGVQGVRVPALMELSIYRKSDVQAVRDSTTYGYFAGHGYACVKIDCRGTGDSDGIAADQFAPEFVDDAVEAVAWIARQPWCDGQVAMTGLSWPGHLCLQVAARAPADLRAIVPMDAADDRYTNKYHGGCLLHYAFTISAALLGMHARPPNPEHAGERWRAMWRERIDQAVVCLEHWLAHPVRDAYWAEGSVRDRYGDIRVPVYASCGLSDPGYAVCVPRLLDGLTAPRKALLGPWAHRMPHYPIPGPGVDFLAEVRRWLDHWMKGIDTGILAEPTVASWIFDPAPAQAQVDEFAGRWVGDGHWPPRDVGMRRLFACAGGLADAPEAEQALEIASPLSVGSAGGEWMPWFVAANGPELSADQAHDDAGSLCFDSSPLEEGIELAGEVRVRLELAADQADAQVALRLCAVAPDGASRRLAFGFLDLACREGDGARLAVVPGERYAIAVDLLPASCRVALGERLRLAVSTSYWPMIWPARRLVRLTVFSGAGTVELPVRVRQAEALRDLGEPTVASGLASTALRAAKAQRHLTQDGATGAMTLTIEEDGGCVRLDDRGVEVDWSGKRVVCIVPGEPLSAAARAEWTWKLRFGDIETSTHASTHLACTERTFEIEAHIEAREGGRLVSERSIRHSVPRP